MCGRFTLRAPEGVVAEQFSLLALPPFTARFNIAPTQPVAVVRMAPEGGGPRRELVWLHWGLIPSWAKDPKIGGRMINARAETAPEKPAYRAAFRRRRCLVAADGFYEWQGTGGRKRPYFIRMRNDRPFAMAGLWEHWTSPDGTEIPSCTLLTTTANDRIRSIHDRMPVILSPDDYDRWMDPAEQRPEAVAPLLRPYPSDAMEAYPVSTYVNKPTNDDPHCIERVV